MSFRDRINAVCLNCADQIVVLVNEFASTHFTKMQTHDLALYPAEYENNPQNGVHRCRVRAAMVPKPSQVPDPATSADPTPILNAPTLTSPAGADPRSLQGMVPAPETNPTTPFDDSPLTLPPWEDVVAKYPAIEIYVDFGIVDPAQNAMAALRSAPTDATTGSQPFGTPAKQVPWSDHANATPITDLIGVQRMFQASCNEVPDVARISNVDIDHARRSREVCNTAWTTQALFEKYRESPPISIDANSFIELVKRHTGMTVIVDDTLDQTVRLEVSPKARTMAPIAPPLRSVVPKADAGQAPAMEKTCKLCGNRMTQWQPKHRNAPVLRCTGCGETVPV